MVSRCSRSVRRDRCRATSSILRACVSIVVDVSSSPIDRTIVYKPSHTTVSSCSHSARTDRCRVTSSILRACVSTTKTASSSPTLTTCVYKPSHSTASSSRSSNVRPSHCRWHSTLVITSSPSHRDSWYTCCHPIIGSSTTGNQAAITSHPMSPSDSSRPSRSFDRWHYGHRSRYFRTSSCSRSSRSCSYFDDTSAVESSTSSLDAPVQVEREIYMRV